MYKYCQECTEPIPINRNNNALFCSNYCKDKNWNKRLNNKDYRKHYQKNYHITLNRKAKIFFLKKNNEAKNNSNPR